MKAFQSKVLLAVNYPSQFRFKWGTRIPVERLARLFTMEPVTDLCNAQVLREYLPTNRWVWEGRVSILEAWERLVRASTSGLCLKKFLTSLVFTTLWWLMGVQMRRWTITRRCAGRSYKDCSSSVSAFRRAIPTFASSSSRQPQETTTERHQARCRTIEKAPEHLASHLPLLRLFVPLYGGFG